MWRRDRLWTGGAVLAFLALAACGGSDDGVTDVEPDPAVQPFVGTWDAEVMTVTSDADTTVVADLIEIDGKFILNIQPSGQYTAQLSFAAVDSLGIDPFVELGQVTVGASYITFHPNGGDPASSEYAFISDDYLQLEGSTDFDFNLDEEPDPATLYLELQRR